MNVMKMFRQRAWLAPLCVVGLLANSAAAVENYYFDVDGANPGFGPPSGGTFDWDDATNGGLWSDGGPTGALNTGSTPTTGWVQGSFPRFNGGSAGQSYTVTVSRDIQIAGMFNQLANTNLTINAIGSGTLQFVGTGNQGIIGSAGSSTTINAPISGAAPTVLNPNNGGNVYFNGVNTYSGGTALTSTATLIHFNNSSAFGTGDMTLNQSGTTVSQTAFLPLLGSGGAAITLANNFVNARSESGVNFAADASTPLISSGAWSLGANNLRLRNNGNSTSPLTLSGAISGTGNITLSANNSGTITFSGANSYSGTTTITGLGGAPSAGTSPVTLKLGAANTIASNSSVILAGGILDPGGFNHTMSSTTLGLTAGSNSTLDYAAGASELDFANSSALTWNGVLNLSNWNPLIDKLRIGTDATGLTSTQLTSIQFNGGGTAQISANGYISAAITGDYNQNGFVDAGDYVVWRKNVGQPAGALPNDPTGVAIGDDQYNLWRANFGSPTPGAGSSTVLDGATVPEPASIALLVLIGGLIMGIRWRPLG